MSKLEAFGFENAMNGEQVQAGWVVRTMMEIQVPYSQLFHVYHNIFESKVDNSNVARSMVHSKIHIVSRGKYLYFN